MHGERFKLGRCTLVIPPDRQYGTAEKVFTGFRFGHGLVSLFAYRTPRGWRIRLIDHTKPFPTLWSAASLARRYLIIQRTFFRN